MKTGIIGILWLVLIAFCWEFVTRANYVPTYILPPLTEVVDSLISQQQYYLRNFLVTFSEASLGLLLGAGLGFSFALAMRYIAPLEAVLTPLVIATQVFPKEALAPIFIVILGFGVSSKIVISALISFFPIVINTLAGLHASPRPYSMTLRSMAASRLDVFWQVHVPFAVPFILSGMKLAATLCVIGAVVGEFIGSSAGLGHVIRAASSEIAMERVYAALLLLGVLGYAMYFSVIALEKFVFKRVVNSLVES